MTAGDDPFDLQGHVALVSGGSRGIGLAIASAFVAHGGRVVITGRSAESLRAAVQTLGGPRAEVLALTADSGDEVQAREVVSDTVARFGRIDTLVNNAATTARFGRLVNVPLSDWDDVMRINVRAALVWSRLVFPIMREQGAGHVINVGSSEGLRLTGGLGAYAVSKAALQMLTRVCAREWAADNVRVNYLAPGVIDTEFSTELVEQIRSSGRHINPMKLIGSPEDVGYMALMLSSPGARFVTGATISVDGGETA